MIGIALQINRPVRPFQSQAKAVPSHPVSRSPNFVFGAATAGTGVARLALNPSPTFNPAHPNPVQPGVCVSQLNTKIINTAIPRRRRPQRGRIPAVRAGPDTLIRRFPRGSLLAKIFGSCWGSGQPVAPGRGRWVWQPAAMHIPTLPTESGDGDLWFWWNRRPLPCTSHRTRPPRLHRATLCSPLSPLLPFARPAIRPGQSDEPSPDREPHLSRRAIHRRPTACTGTYCHLSFASRSRSSDSAQRSTAVAGRLAAPRI